MILDVLIEAGLAGHLDLRQPGEPVFSYDDTYARNPRSTPLSTLFPLAAPTASGDTLQWWLESLLPDHDTLLDYAHELDNKQQREPRGPGRPREHTAFSALLVWILKPHCPSELATVKELKDTANWERVKDAAAAAWPDHPALPLPEKPISRGQYRRFAQRILADNPTELKNLCSHVRRTAAQAARCLGMLDPKDDSLSKPIPRRTAFSDETFLRSRLRRSPSECVDENGEQIHLFDPDAHRRVCRAARSA